MIMLTLAALLTGLALGLTGSGGSILTVPVLRYVLDHPEKTAIAESLGIVSGIALLSAVPYARARRICWRSVLMFGLPGMAGTYLGAWTARWIPGPVQLALFALVMLRAAVLMWRRGTPGPSASEPAVLPQRPLVLAGQGLAVGVLTGIVGVGGGFLIIPALVVLNRLELRTAVGTSLAIITLQSATGFWKHTRVLATLGLAIDWNTIAIFIALGVIGSLVGARLNARIDPAALRTGFALLLVAIAILILSTEILRLVAPA